MNLISYNGQNTLPEQVSVNKANIAILADEVEKLGFTLRGPYDETATYKYNDVVEYQYCMYRVSDEEATALVGVVPTNTTYWQKITDSLRGATGSQGSQGPAGADGSDGQNGEASLIYNYIVESASAPVVDATLTLTKANFNRTPEVDEYFVLYVKHTSTNDTYIVDAKVSSVGSTDVSVVVKQKYGIAGQQGETGKSALVYDQTISFTYGGSSSQLITADLPIAHFNRTPELNEDFVAILSDSGVQYIAQCEVQSISGTNVTSVVASFIVKITGATGQNGQNGSNGVDALTVKGIITINTAPVTDMTFTIDNVSLRVNRTPVVGDTFLVLLQTSGYNSLQYLASCIVNSIQSAYDTMEGKIVQTMTLPSGTVVASIVNSQSATNGQVLTADGSGGADWQTPASGGTTLNKYTFNPSTAYTNAQNWLKIVDIVKNAKGRVTLVITFDLYTSGSEHFTSNYAISPALNSAGTSMIISGGGSPKNYNVAPNQQYVLGFNIVINASTGSQTSTSFSMVDNTGEFITVTSYPVSWEYTQVIYWNDTQLH